MALITYRFSLSSQLAIGLGVDFENQQGDHLCTVARSLK